MLRHKHDCRYISRSLSLGRTHGLGRLELMLTLSHCQLKVASKFDYRRAQSVLRSTDDQYRENSTSPFD